jgi:hypothetical protein
MKFTYPIVTLMLISVLSASCFLFESPERTARKFLTAINERDFETAKKYCTPETVKLVEMLEQMTNAMANPDAEPPVKYEILRHTIDGDNAIVYYRESYSEFDQELKLKKVNGSWKVHFTKEDFSIKSAETAEEEEGYWSGEADTAAVVVDTTSVE